nr:zinc finger, CCHC-type [Tanacetum cinerariifolium]
MQHSQKLRSKSRGERLKCYICQSEDHLKRNCSKNNSKKSTGYVKKDEEPSSSGSTYDDSSVMMVMSAHDLLDRIMDSEGSYHITYKRDYLLNFEEYDDDNILLGDDRKCRIQGTGKVQVQMRDGSSFVLDNVRYVLELRRNLISLGTLEKEGFIVKMQSGKIKVIDGSLVVSRAWSMVLGSLGLISKGSVVRKMLYNFHMHPGKSHSKYIDEFHKLVGDLAAIDTAISDEDHALLLLTSLPSFYDNFVETLLHGRDSLKLEDVLAILNSRELKKMTGAKGDGGEGLYVKGRSG